MKTSLNAGRVGSAMPDEALFIVAGASQYLGASLAVLAFSEMRPYGLVWFRLLGAAIALVLCIRPWRRNWSWGQLRLIAVFGTVLASMNLCFYMALESVPLGTAAAIEFLGPVVVAALGDRRARNWLSVGVIVVGVALLADVQITRSVTGLAWAVGSAAMWGSYILLGSRVARTAGSVDGLAVAMTIGVIVTSPLLMMTIERSGLEASAVGIGMAAGVLSNAIPFGIDQVVLVRVSAARLAVLLALLPVTAAVLGVVVLGQWLTGVEVVGILLVVAALLTRDRSEDRAVQRQELAT